MSIVLAIAATLIAGQIMHRDILARIALVELVVDSTEAGSVDLFYLHAIGGGGFSDHRKVSAQYKAASGQRLQFPIRQRHASRFLIRFNSDAAPVRLRQAYFHSYYGSDRVVKGEALDTFFTSESDATQVRFEKNALSISGTETELGIVNDEKLRIQGPWLAYGVPLVIGLLTFFAALRFDPRRIPSLVQLYSTPAGTRVHQPELDGLRGLAAILVVADHTWGWFTGSGLVGVWIFFALSGYLLAIPFVRNPQLVFHRQDLEKYYRRRIGRIVPMYYTALFIYLIVPGKIHATLPHFLFLRGDGHLWTIPQEMLFYLLLPLVMATMAILLRTRFTVAIAILAISTLWLLWNDQALGLSMYSVPHVRSPFLGWFLAGVCVSYLVNTGHHRDVLDAWRDRFGSAVGIFATILLAALIVLGSVTIMSKLLGKPVNFALAYRPWFGLAAAFLIFAAIFAQRSIFGVIMRNKVLRSYGILGFSVYLLHPLLLELIMKFSTFYLGFRILNFGLFVATMLVTWVVATVTYNLIEYPFLKGRSSGKAEKTS